MAEEDGGSVQGAIAVDSINGSVYVAGIRPRPTDPLSQADVLALKLDVDGNLLWDKIYSAGEIVDPRGHMAVAPGGVVIAGAIQKLKGGIVGIAALLIKLDTEGNLLFDKQWAGKIGEAAKE